MDKFLGIILIIVVLIAFYFFVIQGDPLWRGSIPTN